MKWYLTLMGVSVLSLQGEHLFRNLLAIWVSPVNCLFILLLIFYLFSLLIYRNCLNNLLINYLLVLDFAKVFLPNCHASVKVFNAAF